MIYTTASNIASSVITSLTANHTYKQNILPPFNLHHMNFETNGTRREVINTKSDLRQHIYFALLYKVSYDVNESLQLLMKNLLTLSHKFEPKLHLIFFVLLFFCLFVCWFCCFGF